MKYYLTLSSLSISFMTMENLVFTFLYIEVIKIEILLHQLKLHKKISLPKYNCNFTGDSMFLSDDPD